MTHHNILERENRCYISETSVVYVSGGVHPSLDGCVMGDVRPSPDGCVMGDVRPSPDGCVGGDV